MLRLTAVVDGNPQEYIFNESLITLGRGPNGPDYLHIELQGLQDQHVQILLNQHPPVIVNLANDPFVTLNGRPFAKKSLNVHDQLEIHGLKIGIELFAMVEETSTPSKITLELDEEVPVETPKFNYLNILLKKRWLQKTLLSLLLLFCVTTIGVYYKANDRSAEYHHRAAEGIADISMALLYARAHNIKPAKQSWIDPEFLNNNLTALLSTEYPTFAHINAQGELRHCPYHLRVYTSTDLTQFLVIAQPNPGWLSWFFSPEAIIVDSQAMELYKIFDLKALNRLLVNTNSLDGIQNDILNLIHQGEKIELASLGSKQGFNPPPALKLLRPGAENRIYNAPRYYHFGEEILRDASSFLDTKDTPQELARLQQHIEALKQMPDLVLYSSMGYEKTVQYQAALAAITSTHPFLVACLHMNDNGHIMSSKLLFEAEPPPPKEMDSKLVAEESPEEVPIEQPQLSERELSLRAACEPIMQLLEKNNKEPLEHFEKDFADLILEYLSRNEEFSEKQG